MHPEYGKGEADTKYDGVVVFANGYRQCTTCGMIFEKTMGILTHVRMHKAAGVEQEVDALRAEVSSLRLQVQANVKNLDPYSALSVVGEYVQMIKDECARLTEENETLKQTPTGNPEAEAKIDLIREVLTRVEKGETTMMRALSDINDALEA